MNRIRNRASYLSPQRLRSLIEDVQIATVDEETMPLATCGLFEDAEVDHVP